MLSGFKNVFTLDQVFIYNYHVYSQALLKF